MASGDAFTQSAEEKKVLSLLDAQVISWNKGDIETFMQGYWHNDSLMFVGKNGVTYGYDSVLSRYKRSFPDTASMGQLSFNILHTKALSEDYYFVVGKYHLERTKGDIEGHYTLLFRKINGEWKIICDQSS